jgi:hypothetical protein
LLLLWRQNGTNLLLSLLLQLLELLLCGRIIGPHRLELLQLRLELILITGELLLLGGG